jgi:hypothetical protein
MSKIANQHTLDCLADALVEDILSTPTDELLAEVSEDFGSPRALAVAFDQIALSAASRRSGTSITRQSIPAIDRIGKTKTSSVVEGLRALLQGATALVGNIVLPKRLGLATLSAASIAAIAVIVFPVLLYKPGPASTLATSPLATPPEPSIQASIAARSGTTTASLIQDAIGSYVVQIASLRSAADAQAFLRSLQAKLPKELGNREAVVQRVDPGPDGISFDVMVGTFSSADDAQEFCRSLKDAVNQCGVKGYLSSGE